MSQEELLPVGTNVKFDFNEDGEVLHGVVLSYLPPAERFKGGYHVACYYVTTTDQVEEVEEEDHEFLAQRAVIRGTAQKCGLDYHTVADLLRKGWTYVENMDEVSHWRSPMASMPARTL